MRPQCCGRVFLGCFVNRWRVPVLLMVLCCSLLPCVAAAKELKPWSGGRTPALQLADLDGKSHDLAALRGKVVLVNYWATWCEPCRDEMPSLSRLQNKLDPKRFVVLAVNVDEPESRIRKFLEQTPLGFPVLLDPERKAGKAWNVRVLPASFVIDRNGRIRYTAVGELDWDAEAVSARIAALLPRR